MRALHPNCPAGAKLKEPQALAAQAVRLRAAEKQVLWNFVGEVFERSSICGARLVAALQWLDTNSVR